jgi:hypothetical protein
MFSLQYEQIFSHFRDDSQITDSKYLIGNIIVLIISLENHDQYANGGKNDIYTVT